MKPEIVVVVHNVRSLHNVGSIFRTADGAGVAKIYLVGITPAPLDAFGRVRPQIAKVSLGAERIVAWDGSARRPRAVRRLLENLKHEGYKIFAVEQSRKSIPYYKIPKSYVLSPSAKGGSASGGKYCLVLGNEVRGLPPSILEFADETLEIPMRSALVRDACHPRRVGRGKESLNVSVAFGIVVYALTFGYNKRKI